MVELQVNITIQYYKKDSSKSTSKTNASFKVDVGDDPERYEDDELRSTLRSCFNEYTDMAANNCGSSLFISRRGDTLKVTGVGKRDTRKVHLQGALDMVLGQYGLEAVEFD